MIALPCQGPVQLRIEAGHPNLFETEVRKTRIAAYEHPTCVYKVPADLVAGLVVWLVSAARHALIGVLGRRCRKDRRLIENTARQRGLYHNGDLAFVTQSSRLRHPREPELRDLN